MIEIARDIIQIVCCYGIFCVIGFFHSYLRSQKGIYESVSIIHVIHLGIQYDKVF